MLSSFDLVSNNHGKILKVLADDVKARKIHIIHELYAFIIIKGLLFFLTKIKGLLEPISYPSFFT